MREREADTNEIRMKIEDAQDNAVIFGSGDHNAEKIREAFGSDIVQRGDELIIRGGDTEKAKSAVLDFLWILDRQEDLDAQKTEYVLELNKEGQTYRKSNVKSDIICFTHRERVQDEQLVELVEKMYATYQEKEIGYELQVQSYFYRLLYLMVTKYRKMNVSEEIVREHRNRNRLSSITGYIKENFKEDLSLEGVAQSFGYSPTYLSRMFRKYAKINYKEYVQGIRLEYAYRELTGSDALVEEIAEHNGFADGRAFAKAFQKKYGVRPSEFRRRQKSEDQKMS